LISGRVGTDDAVAIRDNYREERTMAAATAQKTKVCTRCKKRRKVDNFYRDKHMKDGVSSWCKSCTRDYDREYAKRKKAEREAP
jgi:hypothetical protein